MPVCNLEGFMNINFTCTCKILVLTIQKPILIHSIAPHLPMYPLALAGTVESDLSVLKREFKHTSEAFILRTEKSIMKAALLAREQEKEALTEKWEEERMRREAEYEEQKVADNNRWIRERETFRLYAQGKEAEIQQSVLDKEIEHAAGVYLCEIASSSCSPACSRR